MNEQRLQIDSVSSSVGCCDLSLSAIFIWQPGSYFVQYDIHHMEPCQVSLYKNSTPIASSVSSFYMSNCSNSNSFIFTISPEDMIREHSSSPTELACKLKYIIHTLSETGVQINDFYDVSFNNPSTLFSTSIILLQ